MGIFVEDPKESLERVEQAARVEQGRLPAVRKRGPGGTPGGVVEFLAGSAMTLVGFYLLAQRILITSSLSDVWYRQGSPVGIALLAVIGGFALLFRRGASKLGWLLTLGGLATVIILVFLRLNVLFRPTTLWDTVVTLALLGGGFGLVASSLRDHEK